MNPTPSDDPLHAPLRDWSPPAGWTSIATLDVHAGGEPLRIIVDGYPELKGATILERRKYALEHFDELRTALMWEPRGHREMYGCIITPPVTPEADFGIIFLHNEGYSTMCGHGIIAVATAAVQTGMIRPVEPETTIRIDSPAGLITAFASVSGGRVKDVRFRNVPSFVVSLDDSVDVTGIGRVRYDLAFGGAFYAYVDASQLKLRCLQEELPQMVDIGMRIKRAVMESREIKHPFEKELGFLYGTIFIAPPLGTADTRNLCIFADGEVDRSPTGTGVSGRLALNFARHEITPGEPLVVESVIGTTFTGRIVGTTQIGPYQAVIPEVEGTAYITGRHRFVVDPADPLRQGFLI